MAADNKCDTASCGGNCDTCDGNITVTLTLDNDETVECAILTIFPVNGRDYIALLPLDEKQRIDQAVWGDSRFPHHAAQALAGAQPAGSDG